MVLKLTGGLHFHWENQMFLFITANWKPWRNNFKLSFRKHVLSDNKILIETGKYAKSNWK